jgi:hypothetical protein
LLLEVECDQGLSIEVTQAFQPLMDLLLRLISNCGHRRIGVTDDGRFEDFLIDVGQPSSTSRPIDRHSNDDLANPAWKGLGRLQLIQASKRLDENVLAQFLRFIPISQSFESDREDLAFESHAEFIHGGSVTPLGSPDDIVQLVLIGIGI